MSPQPTSLYTHVRTKVLSVWSKNCVKKDNNTTFEASNGHYLIKFEHTEGSTPFLFIQLIGDQRSGDTDLFNGYIRNESDFNLLMELTSVKNPNW